MIEKKQSEELRQVIAKYSTVGLAELDKVKLMDRVDQKFTIGLSQILEILKKAQKNYYMLEVGGFRLSPYISKYFDNEDYKFYYDHHSKKANRYKIRHRHYQSSALSFFEVKFKDNKGRTKKTRILDPQNNSENINTSGKAFIETQTGLEINHLKPVLDIIYQRLTLVNEDYTERVTIDFDLQFKDEHKWLHYGNVVIVEVKQNSIQKSNIVELIKTYRIPALGISKYCLAVISLKQNIKYNGFKAKLHFLRKVTDFKINI